MKNIFISSTFRDMHAERDLVLEKVLPELKSEAGKYGDNVDVIDLRWGVDTSTLETDEGSAKVLKVCMDEIDRSHPYMLIFLGERYGWIPKEELIEKAVESRKAKYITDDFEKSVTALEIEYGALSKQYGNIRNCVVCFRQLVTEEMDKETKKIYTEQEARGILKLQQLKERIEKELGEGGHLITYTGTWDTSGHRVVELKANGEDLDKVLINCYIEMFKEDWKDYEKLSWQEKEERSFQVLMKSKLRSFIGRDVLLEKYYKKVINGTKPFLLQGEVGSGKTSIMCKLAERLEKDGENVFLFFSGNGSMSTSAEFLLRQMLYYVEKHLGLEEHWEEETEKTEKKRGYEEYLERLKELGSMLQEKIYFFIDGLDQLFMDEHMETLDFLIRNEKVQMVLSCTDTFPLSSIILMGIEKEVIPPLQTEDAGEVAESILKAKSRDIFDALEQEILKKKNVGNPLYISLLIQRLNMMGQEELEKLNAGGEINAHTLDLISSFPDALDEATVVILKDAIDKIEQKKGGLWEALCFIAVSRNGLRNGDLKEIFAIRKEEFSVLDFTLLRKYLDGFFYIAEGDRIDVTHKVIRQGILKKIENRNRYEKEIKEYLKTLEENDSLRIQEGMYYARITKDYEFAGSIIRQASDTESGVFEKLFRVIKKEAVEDEGKFYSELLECAKEEKEVIIEYFLYGLLDNFELSQKEMQAGLRIGETLTKCLKSLYESQPNKENLVALAHIYDRMGKRLHDGGEYDKALSNNIKSLAYGERRHNTYPSEYSLNALAMRYGRIGQTLVSLGRYEEALFYCEKENEYSEEVYKNTQNEVCLSELSFSCGRLGNVLSYLGRYEEALPYCEKSIQYNEELHEIFQSQDSFRELLISYCAMGDVLQPLGRYKEALHYYEEQLHGYKVLHEIRQNESSLQDLAITYGRMSDVLCKWGEFGKGFFYCEQELECREELHQSCQSEASYHDLSVSYGRMGTVLCELGRIEESLSYCERWMECNEELHKIRQNAASLRELAISYNQMGIVLQKLSDYKEALFYHEENLRCCIELHSSCQNAASLRELAVSYSLMGEALRDSGQPKEALSYCTQAINYFEEVHRIYQNENSLQELALGSIRIGSVLQILGSYEEALFYYEKYLNGWEKLHESWQSEYSLYNFFLGFEVMGNGFRAWGKWEEAVEYYKAAEILGKKLYDINPSENHTNEYLYVLNAISICLQQLGRTEEAAEYAALAREVEERN